MKSSEKRDGGLGRQANHFSPCVLFPSSHPHPPLPDCYMGHPLPSVPVLPCPPCQPGAPVERQGRRGLGRLRSLGTPGIGVSPARLPRLSLCSRLPRLHPSPSPHVPECARQHPVVFPCRAWLPASPSLRVPLPCKAAHTSARSSRSSFWFSLHCFAPSGLLLLESPGELVWVSVWGVLCAPT